MKLKEHIRILIVDDEAPIREVLSASLKDEGYQVVTAKNGEEGLSLIRSFTPQIVFLDIWMPGSLDGIGVLQTAKKQFPDAEYVMISGHGTIETAVKAARMGAWDFIEKPLSIDKILIQIGNIIHFQNEKAQKQILLSHLRKNFALIGDSSPMILLKEQISALAGQGGPICIVGQKGAGRQLVAQNLHFAGPRAGLSFVEILSNNIPLDLFDYEIFGWSNSIIPGQIPEQKGKLELADGGTLFIRDAHLLPVATQKKIYKFIKTGQIQRAGSQEFVSLDVQMMISTSDINQLDDELAREFEKGQIYVPSLRERAKDIAPLFWYFSDIIIREEGVTRKKLSSKALEILQNYNWPGNLRELRNFVERLYLLTPFDQIEEHDLYFSGLPTEENSPYYQINFRQARNQFEKQFIIEKLKEFDGNISKTAEAIGLERSYLHRKLKLFGIESN